VFSGGIVPGASTAEGMRVHWSLNRFYRVHRDVDLVLRVKCGVMRTAFAQPRGRNAVIHVGEEEFMPVQVAYFYIANPPYMVSNFVFLHEFRLGDACEMACQGTVVPPVSVLAAICESVPGFMRDKFLRRKA
jgi:hypothetical protein